MFTQSFDFTSNRNFKNHEFDFLWNSKKRTSLSSFLSLLQIFTNTRDFLAFTLTNVILVTFNNPSKRVQDWGENDWRVEGLLGVGDRIESFTESRVFPRRDKAHLGALMSFSSGSQAVCCWTHVKEDEATSLFRLSSSWPYSLLHLLEKSLPPLPPPPPPPPPPLLSPFLTFFSLSSSSFSACISPLVLLPFFLPLPFFVFSFLPPPVPPRDRPERAGEVRWERRH